MKWHPINSGLGGLSDSLCELLAARSKEPDWAPTLREDVPFVLLSDYSMVGDNKDGFEVYSFLAVDETGLTDAVHDLHAARERCPKLAGRRISYTKLGDKIKQEAMPEFFLAYQRIRGLVVSFAVSRELGALFRPSNTASQEFDAELVRAFSLFGGTTVERAGRILHFASILTGGLAPAGQKVLWITDEDDIVASPTHQQALGVLYRNLSSHCLNRQLADARLARVSDTKPQLSVEDLLAVPDLIAGAIGEVLDNGWQRHAAAPTGFVLPTHPDVRKKSLAVVGNLLTDIGTLRHTTICIGPGNSGKPKLNSFRFHDLRDYTGG